MSVALQPYTEFEAGDLARQLSEVVRRNATLLEERYVLGPIVRYGGFLDKATFAVEKGQREHAAGELGHFVVFGESGDVEGAANIYPGLSLRKLRLPLPPILARGVLARDLEFATPNISAWADEDIDLTGPYRELLDLSKDEKYHRQARSLDGHKGSAWTVEPIRSPLDVHEAIAASGLRRVADRVFDDQEVRHRVPPVRRLYADIQFRWDSSWGQMKELATGMEGFIEGLENEMISRNPKGG